MVDIGLIIPIPEWINWADVNPKLFHKLLSVADNVLFHNAINHLSAVPVYIADCPKFSHC